VPKERKPCFLPVPGYENYLVSNNGVVVSTIRHSKRCFEVLPQRTEKQGYKNVTLHKDGKNHTLKVHRLVAMAFIPNPNNYPQVNHKDEDKANNCVENLEWCTAKYNSNYGTRVERHKRLVGKKVRQIDPEIGICIETYFSMGEASEKTGIDRGSINNCCLGNRKSAGGYKWEYGDN
jgi:hypothetical protein